MTTLGPKFQCNAKQDINLWASSSPLRAFVSTSRRIRRLDGLCSSWKKCMATFIWSHFFCLALFCRHSFIYRLSALFFVPLAMRALCFVDFVCVSMDLFLLLRFLQQAWHLSFLPKVLTWVRTLSDAPVHSGVIQLLLSLLRVWPIQRHFLRLSDVTMDSILVILSSSSLPITIGQRTP